MKNKYIIVVLIVFSLFGIMKIVNASERNDAKYKSEVGQINSDNKTNDEEENFKETNADSKINDDNATSTTVRSDDEDKNNKEDDNNDDNKISEEHRNTIADVVFKLKEAGDRDDEISDEIKVIADDQATSSIKTEKAMKEIENRSAFKTFLFGTDYKNLGALRSEIVTTDNNIGRLKKASEKASDPAVKAELDTQIEALKNVQEKTDSFIKTNESKFALFGWLIRIFSGE